MHAIKREHESKGEEVHENYLQMQLQFLGEEATARERVIELESLVKAEESAPTLFVVPGVEGMAPAMTALAQNLRAHVFCLQYSLEAETIEEGGCYIYEVNRATCKQNPKP